MAPLSSKASENAFSLALSSGPLIAPSFLPLSPLHFLCGGGVWSDDRPEESDRPR